MIIHSYPWRSMKKDCSRNRSIFYRKTLKKDIQSFSENAQNVSAKGFIIIIAGFYYNGRLKIKRVGTIVKIISLQYQNNVSCPIFTEKVPFLYIKVFRSGNCTKTNH